MEMGFNDQLDRQAGIGGIGQVLADIPPGIDDDRPAGRLVANQIGGLGQAVQVVLGEDHAPAGAAPTLIA